MHGRAAAATFLDSTAMATLLHAVAPRRDDGDAAGVLAGAKGIVERSLTVSRMGARFTTYETREAAIGGTGAGRPPGDQFRRLLYGACGRSTI